MKLNPGFQTSILNFNDKNAKLRQYFTINYIGING